MQLLATYVYQTSDEQLQKVAIAIEKDQWLLETNYTKEKDAIRKRWRELQAICPHRNYNPRRCAEEDLMCSVCGA